MFTEIMPLEIFASNGNESNTNKQPLCLTPFEKDAGMKKT